MRRPNYRALHRDKPSTCGVEEAVRYAKTRPGKQTVTERDDTLADEEYRLSETSGAPRIAGSPAGLKRLARAVARNGGQYIGRFGDEPETGRSGLIDVAPPRGVGFTT